MKWIELIRVRSSEALLSAAMPALRDQVGHLESSLHHAEILFMRHALYNGDLAVVVVWRDGSPAKKSREGLLLAERLQRLGPIDHAVWIPTERDGSVAAQEDLND